MKLKVTINPYPNMKILITKIIHLMRLVSISHGDVILVDWSKNIKFVLFTACLLAGKTLFLVRNNDGVREIKFTERIGTIFYDGFVKYDNYQPANFTASIISEHLFSSVNNFEFLYIHSWSEPHYATYAAIVDSSFKDERDTMNNMFQMRFDRKRLSSMPILTIKQNNKNYTYDSDSIFHMLNAVDSEFENEPKSYVKFDEVSFEQGFIYMLYFFLRGDMISIGDKQVIANILMNSDTKLKEIIFTDNTHVNKNFHKIFKYHIYSNWIMFLDRWWITKWITKFTYDYIIRGKILRRNNHEMVIINKERSLDKSQFLDHTRTRVSVIYGTPADGYTLGINRYTDKELSIVDHSFRVMDAGNSLKLQIDSLSRLCIGGERISGYIKGDKIAQSKTENDLYYLGDVYCELNGEILTIKADLTDIYYYDNECNVAMDVGTRKRSLMAIPYLREVDVFKVKDKFVTIVDIDNDFVNQKFQPNLRHLNGVLTILRNNLIELNDELQESDEMHEVFVSTKFFEWVDSTKHTITREDFIKLLNQQPSNYLKRFLKGEECVIDEVV